MGYVAAFVFGVYVAPLTHVTAEVLRFGWRGLRDDGRGGLRPWWHPFLNVALTYAASPYIAFKNASRR